MHFPAFARERLDPGLDHFFRKLLVVVLSLILCSDGDLLRQVACLFQASVQMPPRGILSNVTLPRSQQIKFSLV